jgi:replicative DNA helicase
MIEYGLISTAIQRPELIAGSDIRSEYFNNEYLATIWSCIDRMISNNEHIDYLTVLNELRAQTGEDFTVYLGKLLKDAVPANSNQSVEAWCERLKDGYRLNGAKAACEALLMEIEDNTQDTIDKAIQSLMSLSRESKNYSCHINDAIRGATEDIERAFASKGLVGITTGLTKLDEQLGGLQEPDLVVIGARSAMGKTGLMMNILLSCGVSSGVISSEMSAKQLAMRGMSLVSDVDLQKLRLAKYTAEESGRLFATTSSNLANKDIWINDRGGITIGEIQRQAREWKQKHDIKILFVDYIQKIKPTFNKTNKVEAVGEVAEGLKNIAKELNIPIVALGQVNRGVEQRPDKRPLMSDLKNSGDIEQEADVVIMIYRDEYYNPDSDKRGIAELCIEKNRSGPVGSIDVAFKPETVKFIDLKY